VKFRSERDGLLEALSIAGRAGSTRGALGAGGSSLQLGLHGNRLDVIGSDPDLVIEARLGVAGEPTARRLFPPVSSSTSCVRSTRAR